MAGSLAMAKILVATFLAVVSASSSVDTSTMWAELDEHCSAGRCALHSGSVKMEDIANTTDCKGRLLAYEYSLKLIPDRAPQREVFDALELEHTCGVTPPKAISSPAKAVSAAAAAKGVMLRVGVPTFFVDASSGSDSNAGSAAKPFKTIARALKATRGNEAQQQKQQRQQQKQERGSSPRTIVLRAGIHYIGSTVELDARDSLLTIAADPTDLKAGKRAWISGGTLLDTKFQKWADAPNASANIWVSDIRADQVQGKGFLGLNTLSSSPPSSSSSATASASSSSDTHGRVTRARYPNGGVEECSGQGTGRCWNHGMKHWHKDLSCVGKARTVYVDLRDCDDEGKLVGGGGAPCKNTSAMWDTYNTYSNGHGGCCEIWSGDDSPYGPMGNYFCGNSSAGGWVGFDDPRGQNRAQGLSPAMPVGFDYDPEAYPFLKTMQDPAGAVMHVWRDQGWFVNMFEVASHDPKSEAVEFAMVTGRDGKTKHVKGGWQGGRGWQVNASAINSTKDDPHDYLLADQWMIENVKEALDAPNEWWFDAKARKLYLIPNATAQPEGRFVAVQLQTLISVNATKAAPARNVTIQGISFRDAGDIVMEPWGVPSGGDWGIYRGGAVFIEGCEGCVVQHCTFERIDGNGIFVSGYTRHTLLADNEFAWIGDSAMAAWGYTQENDGTDGQQPRFTNIERNYVREIGLIEKQSSAWFQAKACQTVVKDNVIFNGPRAGINFNDGFGGSTNVSSNLIFNQCRESGDHGPINSWDRTSYISDVATGEPSYAAAMNNVHNNFIIANYGSSQGFDTDDGSSYYNISDNFFFMADAWKMDYGGHDSIVNNNIIYHGQNDGQNCVNTWPFLPDHGAEYHGNRCILPKSTNLGNLFHGCQCPGKATNPPWKPGTNDPQSECGVDFADNSYYTMNGTAKMSCGDNPDWDDWQHKYGSDSGSTLQGLPSDDELIGWAREKLGM